MRNLSCLVNRLYAHPDLFDLEVPLALNRLGGSCSGLGSFIALLSRRRKVIVVDDLGGAIPLALAVWVVVALLSLLDLSFGNRLYFSIISFDYSFRIPIVESLANHPSLPAVNPLFFPGHDIPFRYHYFWYMVTSLVERVGAPLISPRAAMNASAIWEGFGLVSIIHLFLRFFQPLGATRIAERTLVASGLLLIRGLDLIPMIATQIAWNLRHATYSWKEAGLESWISTMLWVPNHAASLIAFLTGALCLWVAARSGVRKQQASAILIAGVCFASGVGLSIYVAVLFAAYMTILALFLLRQPNRQIFLMVILSGVIALLFVLPFVLELSVGKTGDVRFAVFSVRDDFTPTSFVLSRFHVTDWIARQVIGLALMPLNLAIELGFYFVIGAWKVRELWRTRTSLSTSDLLLLLLLFCSLGVGTFLRSATIANNDLGWRTLLGAQFVLLIWAVEFVTQWRPFSQAGGSLQVPQKWRTALLLTAFIGIGSTAYDLFSFRFSPVLQDAGLAQAPFWIFQDRELGHRSRDLRDAYEWINRHTASDSIVQQNPDTFQDLPYGLYSRRRTRVIGAGLGPNYGGAKSEFDETVAELRPLFAGGRPTSSFSALCHNAHVDMIVIKDLDAVWKSPESWVTTQVPVFTSKHARVYSCPAASS